MGKSEKVCGVCVKREIERGGNGMCPLRGHQLRRGEFERGARVCGYFKLGDGRRRWIPPADQMPTLF